MNDAQKLARTIDDHLNGTGVHGADRKIGFVLISFPFDSPTGMTKVHYISNGIDRMEVPMILEKLAAQIKAGIPPAQGRA